ncbi:methylated-DNA--[protein]-cysteine S-methyltransferase [Conexibacter sp. S30A1]|uniref:methylated-DNA--[protein]-cysteine S-methyltransferase n=1 Tax=Conexibacter sp. S30A1 TaxID=2937800 RepID=UPI00200FE830|nr:methylated-DNA--[protein]-cysteine S-methyltransferase [Conexibacter sp. S30A1]
MSGPPDLTEAFARSGLMDVAYAVEDSPLGRLLLATTATGLVCVQYVRTESDVEAALELIARRLSPRVLRAPSRLEAPRRELDEFFAGRRREFAIALDFALVKTGFTRRVLEQTSLIPFGETVSYREIAGRSGNDRAYRAAGTALGSNPLPIVVPCHRVLHANGGLGGYTGGLQIKRRLLEIEGVLKHGDAA